MRLGLLITLLLLLSASVMGATCDEGDEQWSPALEVARRILNASIEAERQARRDFQAQLAQGALSQREIEDYRFYLDDLERLVQTNSQAVERLRCITVQAAQGTEANEASGLLQTEAEATGAFDAELSASLSEFDELLLRETEAARNSARSTTFSARRGAMSASGQESSAQASASGEGVETSEQASNEATGDANEKVASARGAAGISAGPTPEDIPDGSDDDVVARQLREAAENETDPVLREKLWAEYRKYKNEQL